MMGHHPPQYEGWVEAAGYGKAKDLVTTKSTSNIGGREDRIA